MVTRFVTFWVTFLATFYVNLSLTFLVRPNGVPAASKKPPKTSSVTTLQMTLCNLLPANWVRFSHASLQVSQYPCRREDVNNFRPEKIGYITGFRKILHLKPSYKYL